MPLTPRKLFARSKASTRQNPRKRGRAETDEQELLAVVQLQACARGLSTRRKMGGLVLDGLFAGPTRLFSSGAPSVEALRAKNAAHLFPKRKRREAMELLDQLTSVLDANAESAWARSSSSSDAVSSACFPSPIDLRPRPTPRSTCAIALLGLPLLLLALVAFPWLVAAALLGYAYLRLPRLLGWAVSQAVTSFGLFGYPLTLGAIHLSPWLELRPARLRLRLYVEDFSLANPPSLDCPHRHLVSAGAVDFLLTIDLRWLRELLRTGRLQPVPVHFEQTRVQRVELFFELYQGQLNINALTREIAEREVRVALASRTRSCCRRQPAPALPNLLRLRIGAVRGLRRSGTKPFCVVRARGVALLTTIGTLVGGAEGSGGEWVFDDEMLLRVSDPSTVLHVCVYSSVGRDQLLGQWVLTLKYLVTQPDYCKHAPPLARSRDGSVSGTFLLSDAKLRGSAVRALGPSELGKGYSGEVDMRLHWMHAASLPPPPPPKRRTALEQLKENSGETALRLGSVAELREALSSLPLRLSCGEVSFHDVSVGIKDLFTGYQGDTERDLKKSSKEGRISSRSLAAGAADEEAAGSAGAGGDFFSGVLNKITNTAGLGIDGGGAVGEAAAKGGGLRRTESEERRFRERVAEVTDVVVVKALLLRPVVAKDGGGLDLTAFLDGLLFDQLMPQVINKVFGRVGAKAVGQILAGVAVRSAEWAKGLVKKETGHTQHL